jgi:hypothetical protein
MPSKLSALVRHESLVAERQLLRAIGRSSPPKIARAPSQKPAIAPSQKPAIALMPQAPFGAAGVERAATPRKPRELPGASAEQ